MKYMDLRDDTATPAPMNKIIFGCMESTLNPNIFYFMRLISVQTSSGYQAPAESTYPEQYIIKEYQAAALTTNMSCQAVHSVSVEIFYVAMISNSVADGMSVELYENEIT